MIRRKLFAYTIMFTAGISAGYFIFEKARIAGGTMLLVVVSACIYLAGNPESDDLVRQNRSMKLRLLVCLMAGFALFTLRFVWYGTGLSLDFSRHSFMREEAAENEMRSIEGFARSITVKDGKMKIVLSDVDCLKPGMKAMVTIRLQGSDSPDSSDQGTYNNQANNDSEESIDVSDPYEDPSNYIGRRITAYGTLREPSGAENPGCFDYRVYLRSRGIGYQFSAKSVYLTEDDQPQDGNHIDEHTSFLQNIYGNYIQTLYFARERFLGLFEDRECRAFIKGAVFGDKSDISDEVMEDFNGNGTGHILAVSGLHTGFLYALMRVLTRRKRNLFTAVIIIAVLILYGDMTMWSPSTMRAVTVLSVSIMALYVRRPFDLLSAVSAAALLILAREPYQLFSTGFQMSFLALLGIAFVAKPLSHFIGEALAVMISVQAGIIPITAYCFHRINVLSVFINIPVIFLASLLVPLCMSALFLSSAAGLIGTFRLSESFIGLIVRLSEALTGLIIRLNDMMSAGGIFSDLVTSPGAGIIILFYLAVFMLASEWCRVRLLRHEYRIIVLAMVGIAAVSGCYCLASFNSFGDDEIVFVSVGQGDCTHIRAGEKDVLIDGGGSTDRNIGEDVLMPYLLANGAERTEIALVTHLHTDHYLGISELSKVYPVGAVGIPSDYRKSIEDMRGLSDGSDYEMHDNKQSGTPLQDTEISLPGNIVFIEPGSRINVTDDVNIEPIWPLPGAGGNVDVDDPNEHNMVYMINYRGVKIMVTGDLLEEDELKMVSYYGGTDVLRCDILKVAHHGSKSSSSEALLDAADPEVAVIQVGLNNFYGHPHQQTLDRLAERGIPVYRTDINGAVGIDIIGNSDRKRMKVDLMR